MKNTGVIKCIDNVGRIKIPVELCNSLDIKTNDTIDFLQNEKKIILNKIYSNCIFCNSEKNILNFKNKKICKNCINMIKRRKYMDNLKEKEIELKNRAYKLIEKTKKSYQKYLMERKFLVSLEYLELESFEDYTFFNAKISEIETRVDSDMEKK